MIYMVAKSIKKIMLSMLGATGVHLKEMMLFSSSLFLLQFYT